MSRVTAVFQNQQQAEQAVNALRQMGVADQHLSFISRQVQTADGAGGGHGSGGAHDDHSGDGAGKGLMAGAGIGALFGLAAALIPGVGPFITAGALATTLGSAVAGGTVAGALVGAPIGAISGALAGSGYSKEEAAHYGGAVEQGQILVAVESHPTLSDQQVAQVLRQYGGGFYGA